MYVFFVAVLIILLQSKSKGNVKEFLHNCINCIRVSEEKVLFIGQVCTYKNILKDLKILFSYVFFIV